MTQIIATGEEQAVRFEGTFTVMAQNITNVHQPLKMVVMQIDQSNTYFWY